MVIFPLLCNAYCESKLKFEQNILSWHGSIHFLTNYIDDIKYLKSVTIQKFKKALRDCPFKYYIKEWNLQLKTYILTKSKLPQHF